MYKWHVSSVNSQILEQSDLFIKSRNGEVDLENDENISTWEMFDDDNNWYATGVISGDYEGFEPLDDWGKGSLGCTMIKIDGEIL